MALIFLAGLSLWSPALLPIRAHPIFFISFVIFAIAGTLNRFVQQSFIAKRKAGFVLGQWALLFGLLRFIPLVILAAFFHTFGIFAAWGIALAVAVAVGIFLFLPKVQAGYRPLPAMSKRAVNDMMHFSFTNYAANILWTIPGLVLPLMVLDLLGAQPNAYFYIGWAIGGILFMIPVAASFSLFAEGSYNQEKLAGDIKKSLKLIFLLLIPAIIIIFFLGDKLLLLFGEAYSENATRLLQVLAVSALPLSINHIYFSVKRIEMRMKSVMALTAFIAVTTLASSYVLLPQIGIVGVGIAWLLSQAIVALIVGWSLWHSVKSSVY
jgi:O-antigen/teichoic acid export membrane protein